MGLPYSKQINEAFEQVTPLVAEGFKVLETTKNIAVFLAILQVLNTALLLLILGTLIALLVTVSPDLEHERRTLVTPFLQWFTLWITDPSSRRYLSFVVLVLAIGVSVGAGGAIYMARKSELEDVAEKEEEENIDGEDREE